MFAKSILVKMSLILLFAASVAAQTRDIRKVDFRNFAFDTGDNVNLILKNGKYALEGEANNDSGEIGKIYYADFDGDGFEDAAIVIDTDVDGTMGSKQDYFVYSLRDGKPKQIFYEWRPRGEKFRVQGKTLVIVAPEYGEGDANCCPSKTAIESYRWRKTKFIRVSHKTLKRKH